MGEVDFNIGARGVERVEDAGSRDGYPADGVAECHTERRDESGEHLCQLGYKVCLVGGNVAHLAGTHQGSWLSANRLAMAKHGTQLTAMLVRVMMNMPSNLRLALLMVTS